MIPKRSAKQKKNIKRTGSRKEGERKANCWTEVVFCWTDDIQEALHKLKSVAGSKIRTVASEYGNNESTIRFILKANKLTVKDLIKPGPKCVFFS